MTPQHLNPPFGTADLTNCERELIHLSGSVQPHGVLLVLHPTHLRVLQASSNAESILGAWGIAPHGKSLESLDERLAQRVREMAASEDLTAPAPVACTVATRSGPLPLDGMLHRPPSGGLVLELEPGYAPNSAAGEMTAHISRTLAEGIEAISGGASLPIVYAQTARVMRELTGHDRVMVYKFDIDGHGEIVGESRRQDLEPFLGLNYPSSDIPQRARELYLRNRVRVLADVQYAPAPIMPRISPATGADIDLSMSVLRSMSPLHVEYLTNMGVRATLVCSLIRDGKLWGLIACHHYEPKRVPYPLRAAAGILSELVAAKLSALESQALARAALLVRHLEAQIVESIASTGDWRLALFGAPKMLLAAVDASGAALVHDGELMTAGEVPSSEDIRALVDWVAVESKGEQVYSTRMLARLNPEFSSMARAASGVLAVAISRRRKEYLLWFRPEQAQTLRWAGDPRKPVVDDDPNHLSPRRSFAVWTEQTRGSCRAWSDSDIGTARGIRSSLVDMVQQVQAVRVLLAQQQLQRACLVVEASSDLSLVVDSRGRVIAMSASMREIVQANDWHGGSLEDLPDLFTAPERFRAVIDTIRTEHRGWVGELTMREAGSAGIPIALRADPVPDESGNAIGYILLATNLSGQKSAEASRERMATAISQAREKSRSIEGAVDPETAGIFTAMIEAILSSARRSFSDISGAGNASGDNAALLDIEALTRRAAALAIQLESYAAGRTDDP